MLHSVKERLDIPTWTQHLLLSGHIWINGGGWELLFIHCEVWHPGCVPGTKPGHDATVGHWSCWMVADLGEAAMLAGGHKTHRRGWSDGEVSSLMPHLFFLFFTNWIESWRYQGNSQGQYYQYLTLVSQEISKCRFVLIFFFFWGGGGGGVI